MNQYYYIIKKGKFNYILYHTCSGKHFVFFFLQVIFSVIFSKYNKWNNFPEQRKCIIGGVCFQTEKTTTIRRKVVREADVSPGAQLWTRLKPLKHHGTMVSRKLRPFFHMFW